MKVLGLPFDFRVDIIKQMECDEFCDLYRGKIDDSLLVPAWEELTGNKSGSKRKRTKKK